MNREFLEGLGLEKETIDKVMAEHGRTLNDTKAKAEQVDGLESQINDYKQQLDDRDNQLDQLKKVDAKGLQAEIERLQQENKDTKSDFQAKLDKQSFDFTLERALVGANVRNPKAVKALLDTESIKLDGDKLLNLDDQLTALKESDGYLFKEEQQKQAPQIFVGGNPQGNGSKTITRDQIMKEKDNSKRQRLIRENSHLFQ